MTLPEYLFKMKAFRLQRVDIERDMHLQAWLNIEVQATKKQGSEHVPVYKTFEDFFDYEKRLKEIDKKPKRISNEKSRLAQIALRVNKGVL